MKILSYLLLILALPQIVFAESPPIEVRFTVAITSYKKNFQHNQPFDSLIESAGYDAVWRGKIISTIFSRNFQRILHGSGKTQNIYKIGGGSCTGTLTGNSDLESFAAPIVVQNNNGVVRMKFPLPHVVANSGLNAYLMDKNQPEQSACRTANAGLSTATCFNPTRDCYKLEGNYAPNLPVLPGDETLLGGFSNRLESAYIEFNEKSPSTSVPFSYSVTDTLNDDKGNVTDIIKIVWAGYATITTKPGNGTPPPVDPFTFFDFDPGNISNIPPDVTTPPNPHGGGDPTNFDVRELNSWLNNLKNTIKKFTNSVRGLFGGATNSSTLGDGMTFDIPSRTGSISTDIFGIPPASGNLQIAVEVKAANSVKNFTLSVPKNANAITLQKGVNNSIPIKLSKSSLNLLKSKKALKVFFSTRFKPTGSKKTIQKSASFSLPKRR